MKVFFKSKVMKVFHHEPISRGDHDGTLWRQDMGWFMLLEGSHEAIHIGMEKPTEEYAGKSATVTIEVEQ